MKSHLLTTSVNLPVEVAGLWRRHRREILYLGQRYLRILLRRGELRRKTTRLYNGRGQEYVIVRTTFSGAEYDALHFVAATLRISVSLLVFGMIKFWQNPRRRMSRLRYVTNYWVEAGSWSPRGASVEENLKILRMRIEENPLKAGYFSTS